MHTTAIPPHRLVVVGNGMAGARLVEDVLARANGRPFDVTMFGDEPYGNYNRILLSNVLNGTQDAKEIFLNPLAWYEENGVRLHAGKRVTRVDRENRVVHADGIAELPQAFVTTTTPDDLDPALLAVAHGWEVRPSDAGAELRPAEARRHRSASPA